MRTWLCFVLLAAIATLAFAGRPIPSGQAQTLTPARDSAIEDGVRAFTRAVAQDVTKEGPSAWRKHFADDPAFFMAVDGRLVFPNSVAATVGIQEAARTIKQIELRWGDDLRVDPLAADLAVVASSYHEVQVDPAGHRVEETGYFTGIAEYRDGRWQFRNAHWSDPLPPAPVR